MRKFLIATGVLFAFTACSKSKWDQAASAAEGFRDKMCACKDKACTEQVRKDEKDWQKAHEDMFKDIKDPKDIPKDFMEKMDKVEKEERDCRHKFDAPDMAPPTGDTTAPPATPPAPAP